MLSVHNGIPDPGNNSQTFFSIQGDDEPGLGELGICLGDLFPSISENYPKKRAFLDIRATRAPSILFSAKKGGKQISNKTLLTTVNSDRRQWYHSLR